MFRDNVLDYIKDLKYLCNSPNARLLMVYNNTTNNNNNNNNNNNKEQILPNGLSDISENT